MERRVGCSGCFYWHWRGKFYPELEPTAKWFAHYRRRFNTVELNAPFYRWPKQNTVKQWRRQASPAFRYCIKVNRDITHEKRFVDTAGLVREFCLGIQHELGKLLGCFLFQCPPSLRYSPALLESICRQVSIVPRSVVEFRHKSWWNSDAFDAFREHNIIFCSVSGPRLPDVLVQTTPEVYLRFHGTTAWYRHNYTREELKVWSERLRLGPIERVWAYFNNDFGAYSVRNARAFRMMLLACGKPVVART